MVFGHNTNIKLGGVMFHVQTEDRGEAHGLIDTTVYYQGRVLHRRTNNYYDLFPLDNDESQKALRLRVDEQHRTVLEEMRSGALQLPVPQQTEKTAPAEPVSGSLPAVAHDSERESAAPRRLAVELTNANSWLSGKRATLHLSVKEQNGQPVAGARLEAELEGCADPVIYHGETEGDGKAQIEFEMPRITNNEAALVIRAEDRGAKGQLRFALRVKPRVPSM